MIGLSKRMKTQFVIPVRSPADPRKQTGASQHCEELLRGDFSERKSLSTVRGSSFSCFRLISFTEDGNANTCIGSDTSSHFIHIDVILHPVGVQQLDTVQADERLVAPRRQQLNLEQRSARMRGTEIVLVRKGFFLSIAVLLGIGKQLEERLWSN